MTTDTINLINNIAKARKIDKNTLDTDIVMVMILPLLHLLQGIKKLVDKLEGLQEFDTETWNNGRKNGRYI